MFNPATTLVTYDDCIKHLLFKVADLEGRLQQIEWQNMPIGPRHHEPEFDEERLDAIRKVLGKKEPDCAICYDEEGSWACVRPAHAASLHLHEFVPPPHDDEQQCDADCRANWHKCKTCGKTRTELGLPSQ
jgi:hypothetical protein